MPLHRIQYPSPVALPARLTSFTAHNLGDNPPAIQGGPPTNLPESACQTHQRRGFGEIRTPELPFAAPGVRQDRHPAA